MPANWRRVKQAKKSRGVNRAPTKVDYPSTSPGSGRSHRTVSDELAFANDGSVCGAPRATKGRSRWRLLNDASSSGGHLVKRSQRAAIHAGRYRSAPPTNP